MHRLSFQNWYGCMGSNIPSEMGRCHVSLLNIKFYPRLDRSQSLFYFVSQESHSQAGSATLTPMSNIFLVKSSSLHAHFLVFKLYLSIFTAI